MRRLLKAAAMSAAATTALAGSIDFDLPPIVSGEVTTFDDHHQASEHELSPEQLRAIAHWLSWNRQGWYGSKAKSLPEPVQLQFNLRHSDGTLVTLSVVSPPFGPRKHDAVFTNQGAPWSYHAWFGTIKASAANRPLSESELSLLQKIARE
jgi:hypothetical protein